MARDAVDHAILGAVGFVGDDDDVLACRERRQIGVFLRQKLLDRGEDHAAAGDGEQFAELVPTVGLHGGLAEDFVAALKLPKELIVEIVAVGEDDERRVLHHRVPHDACGVEEHREALPRTLGVPDDAGAAVALFATVHAPGPVGALLFPDSTGERSHAARADGFLDGGVDGVELVVAGDDFVQPIALGVFLEDDKVLEQVEQPALFEDAAHEHFEFVGRLGRILLAVDGAPDFEPLLIGRERADARLRAVGDDQEFVVVEQRGDLSGVGLELLVGVPDRGLLVGGVLQFNDGQRETVEENDYVGPAVVPGLDDRELIHRQPVICLHGAEIHQPHLVAFDRAVGPGILHVHAIAQHFVKRTVGLLERRSAHAQNFSERLLLGIGRYARVEPGNRLAQSPHQHHVAKSLPLRRRFAGREMRPMTERIAQLSEPL